MPATITSIAHYLPPDVKDNSYFEKFLDTSDEWITKRTGIKTRHFLGEGGTSTMLIPAAKECIARRGIKPQDLDCIIVSTVTPDYSFPITAVLVEKGLGLDNVWGFDMNAACSSFVFALVTACKLVESGAARRILLCGGDKMTSIMNPLDKTQAVLFGDGAGAALIEMSDDPRCGLIDFDLSMETDGISHLRLEAGGSANPASFQTVSNKMHYIYQEGQSVFKYAVKGMADVAERLMIRNGLTPETMKWLIPHQANLRIIKATADRMGLVGENAHKVKVNINKYANTTSATIPICISELSQERQLEKGDNLIIASFGAGFTCGGIYFKWNSNGVLD